MCRRLRKAEGRLAITEKKHIRIVSGDRYLISSYSCVVTVNYQSPQVRQVTVKPFLNPEHPVCRKVQSLQTPQLFSKKVATIR